MKYIYFLLFFSIFGYGQNEPKKKLVSSNLAFKNLSHKKFEDSQGKLIVDTLEIKKRFAAHENNLVLNQAKNRLKTANQIPVSLCSNGGFEEFENTSTGVILKNYSYFLGKANNPIQCKSLPSNTVLQSIKEYNPNDNNLMVRIVPSNIIDDYIGDIQAFDQNCLKINHQNSSSNSAVVTAKRFKTDNETTFQFNFKSVLQSIDGNSHEDEQPYFKARAINKNGVVVSEFCLIADVTNCIYSKAAVLQGGSIILFTKKWQSGSLDISAIPNNEEFTIQLISTRCGLEGHFGYTYIDDFCVSHNSENLQGSIELDPLYKICPTLPVSICGSFTLPNSGNVAATIKTLGVKIVNSSNSVVYTSIIPTNVDLVTKKFCFNIDAANLPDLSAGAYNVSANISFEIAATTCTGTVFNEIVDPDANPGWDIWFLNCDATCAITASPATLFSCDTDDNNKEIFNLADANFQLYGSQTGITVEYFPTLSDATNNTNVIAALGSFQSFSTIIFARLKTTDTCFKIIAVRLVVRNPRAFISGILNVCEGSTKLTASSGSSYLWNTGQITRAIDVSANGTYTVKITDSNGCVAEGKVDIIPTTSAPLPSLQTIQPDCFTSSGSITVTSAGIEFSFDNGLTWQTSPTKSNLGYGDYLVKVKTVRRCLSYSSKAKIVPFLTNFPSFTKINPTSCGGFGSIRITTIATEYSFDDGVTWSTNNFLDNLPSGVYKIKTKDTNGCISNYNSVLLNGEFLDRCEFEAQNPYCGNLGSITITTPGVEYSKDGGTTWQTSNTFLNLSIGSYILKVKNNLGCTSKNSYAYLTLLEQTFPQYKVIEAGCGKYATITITTKGDLYSFDDGLNYSSNPALTNQNGISNYKIIVKKGTCKSYTTFYTLRTKFLLNPIPNN